MAPVFHSEIEEFNKALQEYFKKQWDDDAVHYVDCGIVFHVPRCFKDVSAGKGIPNYSVCETGCPLREYCRR